jgi:hypothetical protein
MARLSIEDPAEFACCRAAASRQRISLRDLDKALAPYRNEMARKRPPVETAGPYRVMAGRIVREVFINENPIEVPLCNFDCRITEEITIDDGVEQYLILAFEGQLSNGTPLPRTEIPATTFLE